jgi:peptide/nickel transport system substrate-binding protein
MEANEDYWGGAPEIKKIIFRTAPEASTRVSALLAGDADLITAVPPEDIDFINNSGAAKVSHTASNRVSLWRLERHKPPFDNQKVRQAVNYAANMGGLLETIYAGMGKRVSTILGTWHFGYDDSIPFYPYDPGKAKQLLKESGVPLPIMVNIHTIQGRYAKDKDMAEGIGAMLNELGPDYIKAEVHLREWALHGQKSQACEYDGINFGSWGNWMFDADNMFWPILHSVAEGARGWQCIPGRFRPDWDKMLEEARSTLDQEKRKRIYSELQKQLWDDPTHVFGHHVADIMGVGKRIEWKVRQDEMVWLKEARWRKA